jgi:iron complex outermembrane receptor protein
MSKQLILLAGVSCLTLLTGVAHAADEAASTPAPTTPAASSSSGSEVSEVVITADKVGLLERRPSTTVFGLSKPLIETPRAATMISDTNIQRYGITTIDQLTEVAPGTFTASFYGVPGTLNVRGTLAENYFEGFKLITNFGTYSTPVGDASRIDIVRGPPSPIYGPGFVGGLLNFVPKSASDSGTYLTQTTGEIDVTGGSYAKKNLNVQLGGPVNAGPLQGGVYAYAEYDNSGSFYDGIHPEHFMGELSGRFDLPDSWHLAADFEYYNSSGDVQTPGWNRVTQNLINNQTYITGHNTSLTPSPGAAYLTPNQATPSAPYYPYNYNTCPAGTGDAGLACAYYGFYAGPANWMVLNSGVGTAKLSPHDVYVSGQDFSNTSTPTAYIGLSKDIPWADSTLKFEAFYNGLDNQRYVSYGFPAWERAQAFEARGSYDFKLNGWDDNFKADTIVGASMRYDYSRNMESFDSGLIALDRRDLTVGATPSDSLCSPFSIGDTTDEVPANCMGWETDIHTTWFDYGQFFTTDLTFFKNLDFTLGGRLDEYKVNSVDTGFLDYDYLSGAGEPADHTPLSVSKTEPTYTASVTYKLPFGLMPYLTYAHTAALEFDQAADIETELLENGGWIQYSTLEEAGLKFQELNGTLVGSLDYYHQTRPQLQGGGSGVAPTVVDTVGAGTELEMRWVATKNFSFTFAGNMQHTVVKGPDASFTYLPPQTVCGNNITCLVNSFGGQYVTFNFSSIPGRAGDYEYMPIPHSVASLYGNYVSDDYDWGRVGYTAGVQHTSYTSGTVPNAVIYPAYYLVNMSAFFQHKNIEVDVNVNNVFNKLYFIPDADTYVNMGVLPGVGREVFVTLKGKF